VYLRGPSQDAIGQSVPVPPQTRIRETLRAWLGTHRRALRQVECFLFVFLAAAIVRLAPGANRFIWVSNGVWLAYLLMAPRRHRFAFLRTGFAAQLAGSLLVSTQWTLCLLLTVLNLIEVSTATYVLRRRWTTLPCFTNPRYVLRFLLCAALMAPFVSGLLFAMVSHLWLHTAVAPELVKWMIADGLGAVTATPVCVGMFRSSFMRSLNLRANWIYPLMTGVLCLALCRQGGLPLEFLVYPLLVLILLRMGLGWASLATLCTGVAAGWPLLRGYGTFAGVVSATQLEPGVLLQLFIASSMLILYSVSLVLESRRAAERRLQRIAQLHRLVTENSRDVIIISDFNGNRSYVSEAAAGWGGWLRDDILNRKSFSMIHPEDRAHVSAAIRELKSGADCALVECRVLAQDGQYAWAETSMRAIRDPATRAPVGILQNVRDITDRKQAEKKLQDAYHAVEALAITDSLTGLANRRHFDQKLAAEWRRGMRDRAPLSLLMIDADRFKSYNDAYGHLRGDSCLKQIAEAAQDAALRPGDLIARIGGEEFAVLLPATSNEGAMHLARDICAGLQARALPHRDNPSGFVTVSIGCTTLVPQLGQNSAILVEQADVALYKAKQSGRNRVCSGVCSGQPQNAAVADNLALQAQSALSRNSAR
jgi:diguanylate cyclase (GGDEF)-like protein/PAS domain S-box-containing protein